MQTFQTAGPIAAWIDLLRGDIEITAGDRGDTVVTISPRDEFSEQDLAAARDTRVDFASGVLTIKSTGIRQRLTGPGKQDGAITVRVELPTGSGVTAKTGMGLVHAEGLLGDTSARTGMGDIRLDGTQALTARTGLGDVVVGAAEGAVDIATGTGKVNTGQIRGSATIKNASGEIAIAAIDGKASLRTASGSIRIGSAAGSISARSTAGAIRIADVSAGQITVRTSVGPVGVGVREGTAAWLELDSRYGVVRNGMTAADAPAPSDSRVEVRVRTGTGDITIDRAAA